VDAQALLDRRESLQREADAVVTELRLFDVLGERSSGPRRRRRNRSRRHCPVASTMICG